LDITAERARIAPLEKTLHSEGQRRLVELLIAARHRAGLRQVELAERLGRYQSFVANYESGQRRIDVVEFAAICDALGVKPSTLMRRWERG
jgi:transcriptional regulator with XRE-family HTH domain